MWGNGLCLKCKGERISSTAEPDDNFKIEPISQHTLKVPVQYKGQAEPLDFTEPDATERAKCQWQILAEGRGKLLVLRELRDGTCDLSDEELAGFGITVEMKNRIQNPNRDYERELYNLLDALSDQDAVETVRGLISKVYCLKSETPRIKADAVREFTAEVEKEIIEHLNAENALLKKKLEIALRGLDEYGDSKNWECSYFGISHEHDANCGQDLWYEKDGYELARRIKAEIEEVK